MDSKPFYTSKTFWTNLLIGAAAFYPPAQAYFVAHPEVVVTIFALVNIGLRAITKGAVTIS